MSSIVHDLTRAAAVQPTSSASKRGLVDISVLLPSLVYRLAVVSRAGERDLGPVPEEAPFLEALLEALLEVELLSLLCGVRAVPRAASSSLLSGARAAQAPMAMATEKSGPSRLLPISRGRMGTFIQASTIPQLRA